MLADDSAYLSWMTRFALAVVMVVVMLWIRGRMPDDVAVNSVLPVQSASAQAPSIDAARLTAARENLEST